MRLCVCSCLLMVLAFLLTTPARLWISPHPSSPNQSSEPRLRFNRCRTESVLAFFVISSAPTLPLKRIRRSRVHDSSYHWFPECTSALGPVFDYELHARTLRDIGSAAQHKWYLLNQPTNPRATCAQSRTVHEDEHQSARLHVVLLPQTRALPALWHRQCRAGH